MEQKTDVIQPVEQIIVRKKTAGDDPLVFSSWLKSYYGKSSYTNHIDRSLYYAFHKKVIERILSSDTCYAPIAVDATDPDVIVGYMVTESITEALIIHYVYVKQSFRRLGVARKLFDSMPTPERIYCSHMTDKMVAISKRYEINYCPYLM